MRIHSVLCHTRQFPLLCVTVLHLGLGSTFLRLAMDLYISTEAATHDHLMQFTSPHRNFPHSSSSSSTRSVLSPPRTGSVYPFPGVPSESAVLHVDVSSSYQGDLQGVPEYTGIRMGHTAYEKGSTGAAAVAQPFGYGKISSNTFPVPKSLQFPGLSNRIPTSRYTLGVHELSSKSHLLPHQIQSVQLQGTTQSQRINERVQTQGTPAQGVTGTVFSQPQQRIPVQQPRHQAEGRAPLHRYYELQQQQPQPQQRRQPTEQQQQESPQAASTILGQSVLASSDVFLSNDEYVNVQRLRTQLKDVEAKISGMGATRATRPTSERASRSGLSSFAPGVTPAAADVHRDRLVLQAPFSLSHIRTSSFESPSKSDVDAFDKVAQTDPADPSICNIDASLAYICFSSTECPPAPAGSQFSYACATATSTVLSLPGLCRLPCNSPQRARSDCPLGQACVDMGAEAGICVDVCPPDGLPPCARKTCGITEVCVRNYCRTQGALVDPRLCTPFLRGIEDDYFCDGSRPSITEQ